MLASVSGRRGVAAPRRLRHRTVADGSGPPPLPTASELSVPARAGNQTSTVMSESADALASPLRDRTGADEARRILPRSPSPGKMKRTGRHGLGDRDTALLQRQRFQTVTGSHLQPSHATRRHRRHGPLRKATTAPLTTRMLRLLSADRHDRGPVSHYRRPSHSSVALT